MFTKFGNLMFMNTYFFKDVYSRMITVSITSPEGRELKKEDEKN